MKQYEVIQRWQGLISQAEACGLDYPGVTIRHIAGVKDQCLPGFSGMAFWDPRDQWPFHRLACPEECAQRAMNLSHSNTFATLSGALGMARLVLMVSVRLSSCAP
jgi:hypothetical protein